MSGTTALSTVLYEELGVTRTMRNIPRFGASSDFSEVFGTNEEASGYVTGLLFGGLLMGSVFFAWTVVIAVFKCLGQQRVGFLSGSAFIRPADITIDHNRPFVSRLIFLNSTLLFILFSVLFVTQGLTNIMATFSVVADTSQQITSKMEDIDGVFSDIQAIGENATSIRGVLFTSLATGGLACLELQPDSEGEIRGLVSSFQSALANLGKFQPDENQTEEFQDATRYIAEEVETAGEQSQNLTLSDWQSLVIIIPFLIVPSCLLVGVCFAWFEIDVPLLRKVLSYFLLPVFILQVVFAYSFSAALLIAASANADFCSGGESKTPDGTMFSILRRKGWSEDDMVFKLAAYYIDQCATEAEAPQAYLEDYQFEITAAVTKVSKFAEVLADARNSTICSDDIDILDGFNQVLSELLTKLFLSIQLILDRMDCKEVIRLYTNPVYNGTCTYSVSGFTWSFAAFAVVGAMGLIMIMLRSSWQLDFTTRVEVEIKLSENEEQDEYGGYTGYMEDFSEEEAKEMVKEDIIFGQEQAAYGIAANETFQANESDFADEKDEDLGDDSFGQLQNRSRKSLSMRFSLR